MIISDICLALVQRLVHLSIHVFLQACIQLALGHQDPTCRTQPGRAYLPFWHIFLVLSISISSSCCRFLHTQKKTPLMHAFS